MLIEKISDVQFTRMVKDHRVKICKAIELPYSYADKGYNGYVTDSSTYDAVMEILLTHTAFYAEGKDQ
jgi:hypothetical protein